VNYLAYIPFRMIWGWSGIWDSLPAAHAAAIAFDLMTMLGLMLLGWSLRGQQRGRAGLPVGGISVHGLRARVNSNDALVSLLIVAALLALRWASLRGVMGGLAGLTKFAPLGLRHCCGVASGRGDRACAQPAGSRSVTAWR